MITKEDDTNLAVIVESHDRLSREDPNDALLDFLNILRKGVEIHTLIDNTVYSRKNSKLENLILNGRVCRIRKHCV